MKQIQRPITEGSSALELIEDDETLVLGIFVGKCEPPISTGELPVIKYTKPTKVTRGLTDAHYREMVKGYGEKRTKTFNGLREFKNTFTKDLNKLLRKKDIPTQNLNYV